MCVCMCVCVCVCVCVFIINIYIQETIQSLLDEVSASAHRIGAVNTIVKLKNGYTHTHTRTHTPLHSSGAEC